MSDPEKKALELVAEAEKKLGGGSGSKSGFLGGLFGGGDKTSSAIECYQRAANMFKMAKKWSQAGESFQKCGELHLRGSTPSKHDAASSFIDASNCFKKTEAQKAVSNLSNAIEIYQELGKFSMAAKHNQTIAEILESEGDLSRSVEYFEKAADMFKGEESNAAANKALLKVASHAATMEDYLKAIKTYEDIATNSLESSLLKYSAKEYFFRASLCHLCTDILNAQQAVERYSEMYPAWQDTRECKFVKQLITAVEEEDAESFTEVVKEFDSISRLEQWYTTLLLRVKKSITKDELC